MKAARPVRRRGPGKPTDRNIDTAPRSDPTGSPHGLTPVRQEIQRRDPDRRPPTFEPDLFRARFTLLRRTDHLTEVHQVHLDRLFDGHPRLRTTWDALQELYLLYQADDPQW